MNKRVARKTLEKKQIYENTYDGIKKRVSSIQLNIKKTSVDP